MIYTTKSECQYVSVFLDKLHRTARFVFDIYSIHIIYIYNAGFLWKSHSLDVLSNQIS